MLFRSASKTGKSVIAVFFIDPYKIEKFSNVLKNKNITLVLTYNDTKLAQSYAAQAIFGGIDVSGRTPVTIKNVAPANSGVSYKSFRLGYSLPEEVNVNSKLLTYVDSICNRGVRTKAFPGCQVVLVKDGKIICDRSYGVTD